MIFKVIDYTKNASSDSEAIEKCISAASEISGLKTVVFDEKDYYIDRAILVPSDMEIIIDGCAIRQNDEVYDNVFRGANVTVNPDNPYSHPLDVTYQKNIRITGKNGAKVVGTSKPRIGYHQVLEEEQPMNGDFWGWRTHMFSFSYGEDIEISGLSLSQTMGWAISFDSCSLIHIHDIEFNSNVKNGDGIDFRSGCHDCVVENITGYTSDDTVACTALSPAERTVRPVKNYLFPAEPYNCLGLAHNRDIYNVTIKNIMTGGLHHGVICLAARGNKVYDIAIDNVCEAKNGARESAVKIYTGYGTGYTKGDIHDINVKNVTAQNAKYAVQIDAEVEDVTLENIVQHNPDGVLTVGADQDGVTVI